MAEEQVTVPKFDSNEDEFRMWLLKCTQSDLDLEKH
jgi:hypothetical protein